MTANDVLKEFVVTFGHPPGAPLPDVIEAARRLAEHWREFAERIEAEADELAHYRAQREREERDLEESGGLLSTPEDEAAQDDEAFEPDVTALQAVNSLGRLVAAWPRKTPLRPLIAGLRAYLTTLERMERERTDADELGGLLSTPEEEQRASAVARAVLRTLHEEKSR
jgi:hypothetical protein